MLSTGTFLGLTVPFILPIFGLISGTITLVESYKAYKNYKVKGEIFYNEYETRKKLDEIMEKVVKSFEKEEYINFLLKLSEKFDSETSLIDVVSKDGESIKIKHLKIDPKHIVKHA